MAQSKAFVESSAAVMQQAFPNLVRRAYLSTEGGKCLGSLTCQKDISCTEPLNYFREGKYRQINARELCFTLLRWH